MDRLTEILKDLESAVNYNGTQRQMQVEVGKILKTVYSIADTCRSTTDKEEEKQFWNDLRKCINDFLYKNWL